MKKKLLKIGTAIILSLSLVMCFPVTVHAEETNEEGSFDIFDEILNNMKNAHVDEEGVADVYEELTGDRNYNPLTEAKTSLTKFVRAFRGQSYDEEDFGGNADKVYDGIADGAEKAVNSGILDTIFNFGQSTLNLLARVIGSMAEAIS